MMIANRLEIGFVQVNNAFSGQYYFPYSAGLLEAYARVHLEDSARCSFRLPIFCRQPVEQAVEHLLGVDVAAFSLYVWNEQISLRIARELQQRSPETLIVFGGPQIPDRIGPFLQENSFIHLAVHREGEAVFTLILERLPERDFSDIPGVSYLCRGSSRTNPCPPRIADLGVIPSPYLTGVFDPLMAANPSHQWIAVWETNRGCPFSCTFCDWGSATAKRVYGWEIDRLRREVDWFAEHKIEFVFTADANFGISKRDVEIAHYCAAVRARTGFPVALSVQSTKSGNPGSQLTERAFQVQKILSDSGLNQGVVISMQSLDSETLRSIRRSNISTDAFREIQRRFAAAGVETMTDLIIGLPGETYDSFAEGVSELIEDGQHNRIQFNNLSILPNAEMGNPDYQTRYGMEVIQSRIINIHGFQEESEDAVEEYQRLVVATKAMSRADWVRARMFAWMSAFLHFDKILQIPLMTIRKLTGASYRQIIEVFLDVEVLRGSYPVLEQLRSFFENKAHEIQVGGEEYCHSEKWLGIWWPADEYMFIELVATGGLVGFYQEAEELLRASFAVDRSPEFPKILKDAVSVNRYLVKQPFAEGDVEVQTSWNVLEFHRGVVRGEGPDFQRGRFLYTIDRTSEHWSSFDDWCRRVVWYGNKRGAYLYGNASVTQLSGHF